jgi:hypothetical protein
MTESQFDRFDGHIHQIEAGYCLGEYSRFDHEFTFDCEGGTDLPHVIQPRSAELKPGII